MDWKTRFDCNERLPGSWHVTIVSECGDAPLSVAQAADFDHEPKQEEVEKAAAEAQEEEEARYQSFLDAKADVKYADWSPPVAAEPEPAKERVYVVVDGEGVTIAEFSEKQLAMDAYRTAVSEAVAIAVEAKPVDLGGLEVKR